MKYDEALRLWGAGMLARQNVRLKVSDVDLATVTVEMDIDPGYACCGGSDPNCYCSFAESPRANVEISGARAGTTSRTYRATVDAGDMDITTLLLEILEVSGGTITA